MTTKVESLHIQNAVKYLQNKIDERLPAAAFLNVIAKDNETINMEIEVNFDGLELFSCSFIFKTRQPESMTELLERVEKRILKYLNGRFYK